MSWYVDISPLIEEKDTCEDRKCRDCFLPDNCEMWMSLLMSLPKAEMREDAVSRVDAVLAAIEGVDEWDGGSNPSRCEHIATAIKGIPTVIPNPQEGKWTDNHNGTYTCDRCGCKHGRSKFCPNCGARMK